MSDLVWSIKNGDLDAVRDAVENKNFNVNEEINGRSPLHYAADYGQTELLEYLISKGGAVNCLDKHGISPLLAAIWEGHTGCVKVLIERGAKKSGNCPDGSTYIDAAEKPEIKALLA